jgi:hypothetical protein
LLPKEVVGSTGRSDDERRFDNLATDRGIVEAPRCHLFRGAREGPATTRLCQGYYATIVLDFRPLGLASRLGDGEAGHHPEGTGGDGEGVSASSATDPVNAS